MKRYGFLRMLGIGLATATFGSFAVQSMNKAAPSPPIWYDCFTREVFTPEKQAWCDRWQTLQDAVYIVPTDLGEDPVEYITVTLENGRYRSADETLFVELVNQEGWLAFGDLNGDGQMDAAVILGVALDPDGASIATYLTAVLDVEGAAQALPPIRLGERILLGHVLSIENNRIVLPLLTMTALTQREYVVEGDRLSELVQPPEAEAESMMEDSATLEDTLWYLTSYINSDGEIVAAQSYIEPPSILFSNGQVGGSNGCNRFFGRYVLNENLDERLDENTESNGGLSIQPGGSTLIGCPEAIAAQEFAFSTALEQVTSFAITPDELQLLNANEEVLLTFEKAVQPSLSGTLWQLTAYNNGQGGVVSLLTDTQITATFDEEGSLTGFAGCNRYLARYQATETTIEISPGASTRMFCEQPDGVMDQETAYLQALETAASFTIEGNTLTLRTDTGATVAQFTATEREE